jgi:protoporphyrinogen oxidase
MAENRVAVIGAGIAGLAAAYRLIETGQCHVTVIEAGEEAGGLSRSVHVGDFCFDLGPHQIHTENRQVIQFLEQVLGDDLLVSEKRANQRFLGRDIHYPLRLNDALFNLPFSFSTVSFLSYLRQQVFNLFSEKKPHTFEDWVVSHFGRKLYRVYFGPYTEKVWGLSPRMLTANGAEQRIAVQNLLDVVLNAMSHRTSRFSKHSNLPHSPYQRIFHYPRCGIGQLARQMEKFVVARGGEIRLRQEVVRLESGPDAMQVECGSGWRMQASHIVSTIPVDRLAALLAKPGQNRLPEKLRYRSLIFLLLQLRRPQVTPNHWIYFPDPECIFQRSTEFGNFSPALAPAGKTGICLEIPCNEGDEVWDMAPAALFSRAMDDARRQAFLEPEWIEGYAVVREPCAYPTFEIGYEEKLQRILAGLDREPRLTTIGRQGLFRYINIDDVLLMGFEAADRIVKNLHEPFLSGVAGIRLQC